MASKCRNPVISKGFYCASFHVIGLKKLGKTIFSPSFGNIAVIRLKELYKGRYAFISRKYVLTKK
jgi:hypothetical protein